MFISTDAQPIIKAILEGNKDKKDSDLVYSDGDRNLAPTIQRLYTKAGLDTHGKRLVFHSCRKYLYSRLCNNMAEDYAKAIVGKTVAEKAYCDMGANLRDLYQKAERDLCINANHIREHVNTLEEENKALKPRIKELELQQGVVTTTNAPNSSRIENLEKMVRDLIAAQEAKK